MDSTLKWRVLQVLRGRNIRQDEEEEGDRLARVSSCYGKHGSTFYFTVGRTVRLSIADPPLIKDILIANSDSYTKPLHIRTIGILGEGVFASSGSNWAPQRQLFNGPFHTKEIKVVLQFYTIFFAANRATIKEFLSLCGCDLHPDHICGWFGRARYRQ